MLTLLSAAANGNGTSTLFSNGGDDAVWLVAYGTWGGATAKLQWSPDLGTTWIDVTDASFTANGLVRLFLCAGYVRGVVSGGGGTESITMQVRD